MTQSLRVLMTTAPIGGVWTYSLELFGALARQGVRVILASMGVALRASQRRAVFQIPDVELAESAYKLDWMNDPWLAIDAAGDWLHRIVRRHVIDLVHGLRLPDALSRATHDRSAGTTPGSGWCPGPRIKLCPDRVVIGRSSEAHRMQSHWRDGPSRWAISALSALYTTWRLAGLECERAGAFLQRKRFGQGLVSLESACTLVVLTDAMIDVVNHYSSAMPPTLEWRRTVAEIECWLADARQELPSAASFLCQCAADTDGKVHEALDELMLYISQTN